ISPAWGPMASTQPNTTSSTTAGSTPVRSTRARSTWAPRSAGWTWLSPPPRLPTGVRTASTMYASGIATPFQNGVLHTRPMPGGVAPRGGERPRALHPHVQVVLDGVPDGAVDLQRLAGRKQSRLRRLGLGQ